MTGDRWRLRTCISSNHELLGRGRHLIHFGGLQLLRGGRRGRRHVTSVASHRAWSTVLRRAGVRRIEDLHHLLLLLLLCCRRRANFDVWQIERRRGHGGSRQICRRHERRRRSQNDARPRPDKKVADRRVLDLRLCRRRRKKRQARRAANTSHRATTPAAAL